MSHARWVRWADARVHEHRRRTGTEVAAIWLYGKTPWKALRMWLAEEIRCRGVRWAERLSAIVWPGDRWYPGKKER